MIQMLRSERVCNDVECEDTGGGGRGVAISGNRAASAKY